MFIVIWPQPELVLKLFLNFGQFELGSSYKVVLIKKCVSAKPVSHMCEQSNIDFRVLIVSMLLCFVALEPEYVSNLKTYYHDPYGYTEVYSDNIESASGCVL